LFGKRTTLQLDTAGSGLAASISRVQDGGVGTPEVQVVRIGSSNSAASSVTGTFRLKLYSHLETSTIAFDATEQDLKTELESSFSDSSHPEIEVEVLKIREDNVISYVVAFTQGRPGNLNAEMKIGDVNLLVDGSSSVTQVADVSVLQLGSLEHTMHGLQENQRYRVYVVPSNRIGRGRRSPILSVISADIPTWSASNVPKITSVEARELGISWGMPSLSEIGCSPVTGYRVYQYAGISAGGSVKNDVQRLYTSASEMQKEIQRIEIEHASSGTFTILMTYTDNYGEAQSEATSPLDLSASGSDVQIALNSLFESSSAGVSVTKDPLSSSWNVTFEDEGDMSLLVVETGLLVTDGTGSPSSNVMTLQNGISSIGGDFRLSFQDEETENIPFDASADVLKAALESLTSVGRVSVTTQDLTVTGTFIYNQTVTNTHTHTQTVRYKIVVCGVSDKLRKSSSSCTNFWTAHGNSNSTVCREGSAGKREHTCV